MKPWVLGLVAFTSGVGAYVIAARLFQNATAKGVPVGFAMMFPWVIATFHTAAVRRWIEDRERQ